ncbi:DUF5108 domain-containing protein [Duncaniella muricolitica]|jgi:uncharacterized surface protein with fasciclin (FAS1) repeats|uniref:DUF5108 domain-containing protein n=1 Tax=Duncaniella muricolitica TaxID=2880704 RepID=UPI00244E4E3B|nr:DUF5108 domain-containing protein [Duncaniella muricolitica]
MKTTFLSKALVALTVMAATLTSCDKDVFDPSDHDGGVYKSALYSPIAEYIDGEADFTEYAKALRYSGTFNALNQSTAGVSFTALVPTNEAMQEFYSRRGVSSLEELTPDYVRHFVLYHTVSDSIAIDKFVTMNEIINIEGEPMSVWIDPENAGQAVLGDEARITEMGLSASNGKIYVLSSVLTPLVETLVDRVTDQGNSSIMLQALEASGWKKELSTIADTTVVEGISQIRKRYYTLLNVTDETFSAAGIGSLDALRAKLVSLDTRGLTPDSLLREYVAYHIMQSSYRLADLAGGEGEVSSRLLGSNARNQIMSIDYDGTVSELESRFTFNAQGTSASFVRGACDIQGKNGYVHNLTSWLPVWEPLQTEVIWDLADYSDIKAAVTSYGMSYAPATPTDKDYKMGLGNTVYTYEMGEGGKGSTSYSEGVSYVTPKSIRLPSSANPEIVSAEGYRNDFVVFNVGYMGSVSVKTPVLVKGKYRVELCYYYATGLNFVRTQGSGSNGGLICLSFDGRDDVKDYLNPYKQIPSSVTGFYHSTIFNEVTFDETTDHEFNMIVMDPAASTSSSFYLAFDYIRFVPID